MTDYNDVISRIRKIYNESSPSDQVILKTILEEIADTGESKTYEDLWLADYKEIPVDKYTFLTDSQYLGSSNDNGNSIYPRWMEVMLELEKAGNQYYEIVFTGATRTGKTSTAVSDACYQLYKLMCLRDPQKYFGLKSVTNILIFFFNITSTLAKGVAFKEMNSTIRMSPWFMAHGKMSHSEKYPTYIPEGGLIELATGSDASHALGLATAVVIFDEVNFSQAGIKDIEKSKERMKAKYDTLVARVTGTFVKNGEVYGKLYVISSKNSDSDFMEEYIQKQKLAGNPHMYIFDEPQWKVWPKSKYSSDKMFHIAIGGKKLKSFVVPDDTDEAGLEELRSQGYQIMEVPEDNKVRFLSDFEIALRDIAGVSVPGMFAYITQDVIDGCIGDRKNPFFTEIVSIGVKDTNTLEEFFHQEVIPQNIKKAPMFIHLDLSLTTDRTGISGVAITGRKDVNAGDRVISMPTLTHIFSVGIEAPRNDKIPYDKITAFIVWLRRQGFNIEKITRDQFQSEYLAQLLEAQGFGEIKKVSLDKTPDGYMALRSILTEQRIDMLNCEKLQDELIHLQRDANSGKIDHPVGGCFTRDTKIKLYDGREVTIQWLMHNYNYRYCEVYTINEDTLEVEPKKIKNVFKSKFAHKLLRMELSNGEIVYCTPDHRFMLSNGYYIEAQNLTEDYALMTLDSAIRVVKSSIVGRPCDVFDLTIEDNPNFSLGCGIFVHNSKDEADSFAGAVWTAIVDNPGVNVPIKSVAKAMKTVNSSMSRTGIQSIFVDPRYKK